VSWHGQVIAFLSSATNLICADTNGMSDLFARDMRRVTTYRIGLW
jgi:hypothetical protein